MAIARQTAKAELRAALRAQRDGLTADDAQARSAAITRHALHLPAVRDAAVLCSYLAVGREVDTRALISLALAAGKCVLLPRTRPEAGRLTLHAVEDLAGLVPGPYGILEPPADAPETAPADVDCFLVPGCAFDVTGNRLGYGGGYYDRLLAAVPGHRVALAYGLQVIPRVPTGPTDQPVTWIVTEDGVLDCTQGRRADDWLRLRNMVFHGRHGAHPHEREHGLRLAMDVELRLDLQVPGLTDDLTRTVDYPAIYRLIEGLQCAQSFTLLEALAARAAAAILDAYPAVAEVIVRARKFHPPVGGLMDAFEAEVRRGRE
jgi:5-formyltetrahydrofolate cyclo-ligase